MANQQSGNRRWVQRVARDACRALPPSPPTQRDVAQQAGGGGRGGGRGVQ